MSMIQDLEQIVTTVLPRDPSFRSVERKAIDRFIGEARAHAHANAKDDYLLSLMRLLALPGNGHTRLIPNDAISVLPLRFVSIGTAVYLRDAAQEFSDAVGDELVSINGVPVGEIETAADSYLAGTPQRKRVIGPILFAWPGALRRFGVCSGGDAILYQLRTQAGEVREYVVDTALGVSGSAYYPRSEHGKADAGWSPSAFLEIGDFDQTGLSLTLPSFFDPGETALSKAIAEAAETVRSDPDIPLLIDVRGNTGGNFLLTMPLIEAISDGADERRVAVLVDKFTFSAAIVFVAILRHRLGDRLFLVGEEMGDGLTFFAEGGTIDLTGSGAAVRYSTAFHDWTGGRADATTPAEIAERLVPVGSLVLDQSWVQKPVDIETPVQFYREVLRRLSS